MKIRLHQFLSKTGKFRSKREIIDSIVKGEVKVDGSIVNSPHYQFDPAKKVEWNKEKLEMNQKLKYFILNKPSGYLCSRLTKNDIDKKSVFSLLEPDNSLVCAGRLDEDTTGLIIITNDGKLSHDLTHPESGIEKTYEVFLDKPITKVKEIENGIFIKLEENGELIKYKTKPCKVQVLGEKKAILVLTEGRKREVKRIFEAVGNKVAGLKRIGIGLLKLDKLRIIPGRFLEVKKEFLEEKIKGLDLRDPAGNK